MCAQIYIYIHTYIYICMYVNMYILYFYIFSIFILVFTRVCICIFIFLFTVIMFILYPHFFIFIFMFTLCKSLCASCYGPTMHNIAFVASGPWTGGPSSSIRCPLEMSPPDPKTSCAPTWAAFNLLAASTFVSGSASLGSKYITLGIQIAQSRSHLYTLGPKVGIICILGALG